MFGSRSLALPSPLIAPPGAERQLVLPPDFRIFPAPGSAVAEGTAIRHEQVFSATALTPERRLVVQCARAMAGSDAEPALADLLSADAGLLVPLAWRHGVLPWLGRRVAAVAGAAAHPSFAALRGALLENGVRALRLAGELADVVAVLEAAGVESLAYKGPALALQAYGDASLRDYGDLDLVVRKDELAAAEAALVSAGFQPTCPPGPERAALLRDGHHLAFRRDGVLVEVHWRFAKAVFGFAPEVGGLFARAETIDLRGRRVRALSVPDHLLALAIHASRGLWSSLDGTVCIARLAARVPAGEWPGIAERAQRWRCDEALRVSLLLGELMLGAAYPAELQRFLPPTQRARRLAARVAAELFMDGFGGRSYVLGQLALRPRYRDRLRFAAAALLHAGAGWADAGAGAALARPLRVVRKYWRQGSS